MKSPLPVSILAVVVALAGWAGADTAPSGGYDSILFLGQTYCQGVDYCSNFAVWGIPATPAGYVLLTDPDGTPSDLLWVDFNGHLTFESAPLNMPPPGGLPLLGTLVENGTLQEVDQFFPGGGSRPLFVQSEVNQGMNSPASTPEPSTLWLAGSGGVFLLRRMRRLLRRAKCDY